MLIEYKIQSLENINCHYFYFSLILRGAASGATLDRLLQPESHSDRSARYYYSHQ